MKLVVLDVSYNHIADLPMQIGELSLLRFVSSVGVRLDVNLMIVENSERRSTNC